MAEKKNIKAIYEACGALTREVEAQFEKDKNAKIDPEILNTLTASFNDIIEFERTHLIMAHDAFYGCMLMNMDTAIDFSQKGAVDTDVSGDPFVMKFNPLYCSKYKYTEFTGLIVSEILRIAFAHPAIYAELNKEKDNRKHENLDKASSAAVSSMVQNDIRLDDSSSNRTLRLPNDAYTVSKLNEELTVSPKRNDSLNYYFRLLEKFKKQDAGQSSQSQDNQEQKGGSSQDQSQSQGSGSGKSQNQNNNGQENQQQGSENEDGSNSGNSVSTMNNNKGNSIHNWEGSGDSEDTKERIKNMVGEVYNSLSEKQRGYMPDGLQNAIKELLAPPQINWKQFLRKLIGTIPVPYRKTRTRLNRRLPYRSDLSGRLPKRTVHIVCVFDTSGSMGDREIAYCMNEVFNITKAYEGTEITIIECDADIQRIYKAKNMNQIQRKVCGRGGTSFIPPIELINGEKQYKKKYPEYAGKFGDALMVYFTDGYGDCEIPKPKTYRNLWVIMENEKNLSVTNPYGEVKSLSTDKDYMKLRNGEY